MKNVLISVSDRTGILEFARGLDKLGFGVVATSGTQKFLASEGIPAKTVSETTGFPEILDGRVKTLHPKILGAILADIGKESHLAQLKEHGIPVFELVVCNLYPFGAKPGIENIDIGGITLIRAAAKNHKHVACVTDISQYDSILAELTEHGKVTDDTKAKLAAKAFRLTSSFDTRIATFLGDETLNLSYEKAGDLRYGENAHQKSSLYKEVGRQGLSISDAVKLQGKEISFNNFYDLDAALSVVKGFDESCVCVLKHATPCGVAVGDDMAEVYKNAYRGDPMSAFGGVIAFNRNVDKSAAEEITKTFMSALIAPGYTDDARKVLAKKKNLVVVQLDMNEAFAPAAFRWISGGLLVQDNDISDDDPTEWKVVTDTKPTPEELKATEFAFKIAKFVKSNAICITTDKMTLGIGGGQPNRVGALEIAIQNMKRFDLAGEKPKVIASDGFFPFRDSADLAAKAGIRVIIQPGGSVRDQEVTDACNEHGIAMLLTHKRHFRH
jgi:phosphoribosylaminoimidazolecarboxamide formyltransferase/IMP cyclohydrolase